MTYVILACIAIVIAFLAALLLAPVEGTGDLPPLHQTRLLGPGIVGGLLDGGIL